MAAPRGVSFEHKQGTGCTDARFHRHCQGRFRGSVSLGFDAQGKRIRRRVTAETKTGCLEAINKLLEELGQAPKSSRKYTVARALMIGWPRGCRAARTARSPLIGPLPGRWSSASGIDR